MFGRNKIPDAKTAKASGELQLMRPVSPSREVRVSSDRAQADMQPQALTKDYSVLESVDGDGLVLIGKNTRLVGEITNCSKVEIQGALEGTLVAESVVVREGGMVKGTVRTTNAAVQGIIDGEIAVTGLLDVKSTGQVTGDVSYGQFSVQVRGHISGQLNSATTTEPPQYDQGHNAVEMPLAGRTVNGRAQD